MSRPPLPERLRPQTLDQVIGHQHLLQPNGELGRMLGTRQLHSLVLWGPPGCGKTTLARLLAAHLDARWVPMSAVLDGVGALRKIVDDLDQPSLDPRPTVVFIDEIHRWNKAQQDALLPHVESGSLTLLGATTEPPSLTLRPALRSRVRILALEPPTLDDITTLLQRAWSDPAGLGRPEVPTDDAVQDLARSSGGDVRRALLDLQRLSDALPDRAFLPEDLPTILGAPNLRHDRDGDSHHDLTSAWIKSMRGSDPDAAIYWLARLLAGGEDLAFLCRRLVIFAAEDVGNADPRGLTVATSAAQAAQMVGMPEARIPLAQATTWLASAPKSNASYTAINEAMADVERTGGLPVPFHLRNAPGATERVQGWGEGYLNPHHHPDHIVEQPYRPVDAPRATYYRPVDHGEERTIGQRLAWWRRRLKERGREPT